MIENTLQTQLQERLLAEKAQLESQLNAMGHQVTDGDWAAMPAAVDEAEQELAMEADRVADFETKIAVLSEIESRYQDVVDALAKITAGTYGVCEVSGATIEDERLLANPAARTCMAHM